MTVAAVLCALVLVAVVIGMIRTYVRLYEDGDRVGAGFVSVGAFQLVLVTAFWLCGVDPNV